MPHCGAPGRPGQCRGDRRGYWCHGAHSGRRSAGRWPGTLSGESETLRHESEGSESWAKGPGRRLDGHLVGHCGPQCGGENRRSGRAPGPGPGASNA
jgi:hypothetical protein